MVKLGSNATAEIFNRWQTDTGLGIGQLRLYTLPFSRKIIGLLVEAERFSGCGIECKQVIPEFSELLIQTRKLTVQLVMCIVLAALKPTEFGLDILVQLGIVTEFDQIIPDQQEHMVLNHVCRHAVAFRAAILVSSLVGAAGVVAGLVALAAGSGGSGEFAATDPAEYQPSKQVVALHGVAPVIGLVLALGFLPFLLDSFKGFLVNDGRPSIFTDYPIVLAPLFDPLIGSFDA